MIALETQKLFACGCMLQLCMLDKKVGNFSPFILQRGEWVGELHSLQNDQPYILEEL